MYQDFYHLSQQENVINDYLNNSFRQERTYKRFIKELPEYSQLLLVKTDDELVTIKENIKTIFKCIILEDAHLRFAVLDASGNIFSTNNLSTAGYNRSSLAQKIKEKIDTQFSAFEVKYLNNKIFGWNAISYYLYEISKVTGQFIFFRPLTRTSCHTTRDLMFELVEEAVSSVSDSFITNTTAENQLLYSAIEGTEPASIVYSFETPPLTSGALSAGDFSQFVTNSIETRGSGGNSKDFIFDIQHVL